MNIYKTFLILTFFISTITFGSAYASPCLDAGNYCHQACGTGFESVPELSCDSGTAYGPDVCCKEVMDLSKTPKIILNKETFEKGDIMEISVELPYIANCDYYFTNPSGFDVLEGSGGCGYSGELPETTLSIDNRLKQLFDSLFGSFEPGTYTLKVIASKPGFNNITLIKKFEVITSSSTINSKCRIDNGEGVCNFLDESYTISNKGCNQDTFVGISYGNNKEALNGGVGDQIELKNGVIVKIDSTPCSAYLVWISFKKKADFSISKEGTFLVKTGSTISLNKVHATINQISWALSGDTDPKIMISGDNAQLCEIKIGEKCEITYGPGSHPISENLEISVNKIYRNEDDPEESAASINMKIINNVIKYVEPTEETGPLEIVNEQDYTCSGCKLENKCYPFGYRKDGQYCSDNNNFINQLTESSSCENNFQCQTNICVDSKCVSSGIWESFLAWFKNIFGWA